MVSWPEVYALGITLSKSDSCNTHEIADQCLRCRQVRRAARFRTVIGCNEVITSRGRVEGAVIVVASGPASNVPQMAGLRCPTKLNPAVFCVAKGPFQSQVIEIYFGSVAPGGYAWLIPKHDTANIGIGFPREYSFKSMRARLESFLACFPHAEVQYVSGGHIPLGGRLSPLVRGRRLAVGDAGGMVMASNGGGNLPALISGQLAGIAIAAHLHSGFPLGNYEKALHAVIGTELEIARRRKLIFDVVYRYALRSDLAFEAFFRLGGTILLEKAIRIAPLLESRPAFLPAVVRDFVNSRL